MQRIVPHPHSPWLLLSSLLLLPSVLSLPATVSAQSFLQQRVLQTTNGDVVIADMDDFSDWLFSQSGEDYDTSDDYRVYRVNSTQTETRDYVIDSDDYNNPAARNYRSFIDVSPEQNPMGRDTDELPSDPNDIGKEHYRGDLSWVLVTSWTAGEVNTGKVWAVPRDRDDRDQAFVLVGGLQTPTGVCFDRNHEFVYVCDPGQGTIYQYSVNWKGEKRFVLDSDLVATIAQNVTAQDCTVDAYGNLFYVDSAANSIVEVDYLSLWAGYLTIGRVMYTAEDFPGLLSAPQAIDIWKSRTIYYINGANSRDVGVLNSANADFDREEITIEVREDRVPYGLAVTPDYAYFSLSDGSVFST